MSPNDRLVQAPTNALAYASGIIIVVMMCHVVLDVGGRLLFHHPLEGTLEIVSNYYMVPIIFFPLAYVSHYEGHIMVELFTRKMKTRSIARMELVIGIVSLIFVGFFFVESVISAIDSYVEGEIRETAASFIHIWPSRFALPIGLGLMWLYVVYRVVEDFRIATGRK